MLPEALVIFACVNSTGCSQTSSHYFNTHPDVRESIKKHERIVQEFIGPYVIQTAGPLIYVVAGGTGTVRLNKYFNLQLSTQKSTLMFSKEF